MKTRLSHLLLFFVSTLLIASCDKEQWKETVATEVSISAENTSIFFGVNELRIDTIIMSLESLTLNGSRLQAENIQLTASVGNEFTMVNGSTSTVSSFSVPQGTYESFQLTSKFGGSSPSVVIIGEYVQPSGNNKKVLLRLNYNEFLIDEMVNGNAISIDKANPGNIRIVVDPNVLFSGLNPSYWNSANNSNINGQNGIEISSSENSDMFNEISPKMNESVSYKYEY